MPIYGQKCTNAECEAIFNDMRAMSQSDVLPPCPKCGTETIREYSLISSRSSAAAVVVFKAPDGSYRFPGATSGRSVDNYERLGYQRVELRGFAEVRKFERDVNTREASEIARKVERRLEMREMAEKRRRSEITHGLRNSFQIPEVDEKGRRTGRMKSVKMSERGIAIMQAAQAQNYERPRPRAYEGGIFVEVYSNDRSNRDDSRGSDGRRFRD
jgi:putative FmdB family regulatory protein